MLPFPIYTIPEPVEKKMPQPGAWLCVIVEKSLSPENLDLLQKICAALKAHFEKEVFVVETSKNTSTTLHDTGLKLVLSFGIKPAHLGIWIDLHTSGIKFLEAYTFILTTDLDTLAQNPGIKKQLWNDMQDFLAHNQGR